MKEQQNETTLIETIEFLRRENKEQKERIARLEHQVELLTEAIRLLRQKRFGASSERSSEVEAKQLSLLLFIRIRKRRRMRKRILTWLLQRISGAKSTNIRWIIFRKMFPWKSWNTVLQQKSLSALRAEIP